MTQSLTKEQQREALEKLIRDRVFRTGGVRRGPKLKAQKVKSVLIAKDAEPGDDDSAQILVPILKADRQLITGVVLQPEVVDGQGDIYSAEVIEAAAHKFLANYNKTTKLGLNHTKFKSSQWALAECWIAPVGLSIGNKVVKAGSWIMTLKVLDPAIWKKVKAGELTGFSIGGKARVKHLK